MKLLNGSGSTSSLQGSMIFLVHFRMALSSAGLADQAGQSKTACSNRVHENWHGMLDHNSVHVQEVLVGQGE